jgi:hypothetical protein
VDDLYGGDAGGLESLVEGSCKLFRGQRNKTWAPAEGLFECLVHVVAGGERGYLVSVGELLDDGEGALADGAG